MPAPPPVPNQKAGLQHVSGIGCYGTAESRSVKGLTGHFLLGFLLLSTSRFAQLLILSVVKVLSYLLFGLTTQMHLARESRRNVTDDKQKSQKLCQESQLNTDLLGGGVALTIGRPESEWDRF